MSAAGGSHPHARVLVLNCGSSSVKYQLLEPDGAGVLAGLLRSATHVSGAWGSGRLVKTGLVSMLITSNGHVLIGAVAPSVLYSAAAQAG